MRIWFLARENQFFFIINPLFCWKSPDKVAGCHGNGVENRWLGLWAVCGWSLHVLLLENLRLRFLKSGALAYQQVKRW